MMAEKEIIVTEEICKKLIETLGRVFGVESIETVWGDHQRNIPKNWIPSFVLKAKDCNQKKFKETVSRITKLKRVLDDYNSAGGYDSSYVFVIMHKTSTFTLLPYYFSISPRVRKERKLKMEQSYKQYRELCFGYLQDLTEHINKKFPK